MSYIQNSLGDGEKIVALARFHWWYSTKAWLALILPLLLVIAPLEESNPSLREWTIDRKSTRLNSSHT